MLRGFRSKIYLDGNIIHLNQWNNGQFGPDLRKVSTKDLVESVRSKGITNSPQIIFQQTFQDL